MNTKALSLFASLLFLAACGGSDDPIEEVQKPEPPRPTTANTNANPSYIAEYRRLEMPRLHGGATDTILIHKANGTVNYMVEWDYARKTQRWSCYVLDSNTLKTGTQRYRSDTNQYPDDPLLPTSMQWASDPFRRSSYDHGHICPSADRLNTAEANYQTFFMTNMQPQFNRFNAGLWAKLETKVRDIAKTCDTLYICKGGTIDEGQYGGYNKIYQTTGKGLIVPRYFYMALLRVNNGQYNAIGLWTDQIINVEDPGTKLSQYAISIDELESRTGIDFFCNLPDDTENTVERSLDNTLGWGL